MHSRINEPRSHRVTRAVRNSEHQAIHAKRLALAAMSLGYAVVQLDVTIVNTALQSIGASLGGGISELQWVVSAYTVAFAALIMTAGAFGDRVGAKRVFMAGFGIFTVASAGCALAPTAALLIGARSVQGIGAAVLVPNSLALLNHAYPNETERGRAVGIWAAGASVALTAGPLVGGVLIDLFGWRSIFLVNLPLGLGALWLTWRYADETPASPTHELDLFGQVAAIGALGCLAGAIIEAGARGWNDPWVLSGFGVALVLAVLFLLHERRARQPMLPLNLFGARSFTLTSVIGLLVDVAFYGLIFVFSLYFQQINKWSPLMTGLAFLPMMGGVLLMNLVAPRISERLGGPVTITAACLIAAAGCLGLLIIASHTAYIKLCAQLLAIGGGVGLLVAPLTSILLGSVHKKHSGLAAGMLNSTRQTGSVLGVALFGSLLGALGSFLTGARVSLFVAAVLFSAAAATAIMIRERGCAAD
jgi:DHA2 family methylenomycin A resistance protein-like MFS transporter